MVYVSRVANRLFQKKMNIFDFHFNPKTKEVSRIIKTAGDIFDNTELEKVRRFVSGESLVPYNAFEADLPLNDPEAFAQLRRNS